MNLEFEKIWDERISERLKRGELNIEMDIGSAIRTELENKGLIGQQNPLWRCYQDLMLLRDPCKERYDLILMKYNSEDNPKSHYPAIVAEFKLWNTNIKYFDNDLKKVQKLLKEDYPLRDTHTKEGYSNRPYAYHLMYIMDIRLRQTKNNWKEKLEMIENSPKYLVKIHIYNPEDANKIIDKKTKLSQWCRYDGNTDKMVWIPTEKRPLNHRELWQIRVSRIISEKGSYL